MASEFKVDKVSAAGATSDATIESPGGDVVLSAPNGRVKNLNPEAGTIVQVQQAVFSSSDGNPVYVNVPAYNNNTANFRSVPGFSLSLTAKHDGSLFLVHLVTSAHAPSGSHLYVDAERSVNGGTGVLLSATIAASQDGMSNSHYGGSYQNGNGHSFIYLDNPFVNAGDIVEYTPFFGAWSAGNIGVTGYTNSNAVSPAFLIVQEVAQ